MPFFSKRSSKDKDNKEKKDGSISPGWSALDKPIPIGASTSKLQEANLEAVDEHEHGHPSPTAPATYVASQPYGDKTEIIMDQIADEFERVANTHRRQNSPGTSDMKDSGGDDGTTVSGHVFTNGKLEDQALMGEETEVWTGDEEKSNLTEDYTLPLKNQDCSTITEQSKIPAREHTYTSNTTTLSSDGDGSNNDIRAKDVVEPEANHDATSENSATGSSDDTGIETVNDGGSQTQADTRQEQHGNACQGNPPGAIGTRPQNQTGSSINNAGAPLRLRAGTQPIVSNPVSTAANQTISGRPPDGRNRRWNFSMNGSQSARGEAASGSFPEANGNGVQQKALLEIMGLGLGNFTNDMATIVIDKLRPEYDVIARRVGQAVKEETTAELTELREKVDAAEKLLNHLEAEKNRIQDVLQKEKDQIRKELDKEKTKRMKESEEKNEKIDKLESELKKAQMLNQEKDRMSRRAQSKAKTEEHRRHQAEESCENKLKELQKEISKLKSAVLVEKSKNRVVSSTTRDMVKSGSLARKLKSYHDSSKGKWPTAHPKHVPYDEGDP